jgi:hypothetical protein
VAGFCECGNEPLDFIKDEELLDQLTVSFTRRTSSMELISTVLAYCM